METAFRRGILVSLERAKKREGQDPRVWERKWEKQFSLMVFGISARDSFLYFNFSPYGVREKTLIASTDDVSVGRKLKVVEIDIQFTSTRICKLHQS